MGRNDSQLPDLTPIDFALFWRAMPAAGSGADGPSSVAGGLRDGRQNRRLDAVQAFTRWNRASHRSRLTAPGI